MIFSGDGARAAGPPAWRAISPLAGESLAARDDPALPATVRGPRVLSLTVEAPPRDAAGPQDLRITFDGGFELRLAAAPEAGVPGAAPPIDHVTVCVYPENLDTYAGLLCASLPSASCGRYSVGSGDSGMRIAAISDPATGAHIVLAAPIGKTGQVADFLANTGCEGLQHVAFTVPSVHETLGALAGRGMRFIGATAGDAGDAVIELREDDRWLRQAFTEPLWGEFFVEILERNGIDGLHASNIESLYKMNERGRALISDAPALHAPG